MHLMPAKGQNSFTSPAPSNPTHQWWSAVYSLMDLCKVMKCIFHTWFPLACRQLWYCWGPELNQTGDKIPVSDPETCWHSEWHNTEQNKAKQNRTWLRPGRYCHFPIPNNASLHSGNIPALKQLTLLFPPIEEDTSCVLGLWEDKNELLITWFGVPEPRHERAVLVHEWCSPADLHWGRLLPSIPRAEDAPRTPCAPEKSVFEKRMGRGREVLSRDIYIPSEVVFLRKFPLYGRGWTMKPRSTPLESSSHTGKKN